MKLANKIGKQKTKLAAARQNFENVCCCLFFNFSNLFLSILANLREKSKQFG